MTSESARNRLCLMRTCIIILLIPSSYPNWIFHPIFSFCSSHTKNIFCFISLPTFSVLFICIPVLFFCFPSLTVISALLLAFGLSLGESHAETSPSSSLYPSFSFFSCFILSSLPPPLSHLCFYPLTYSVTRFHLHSHSSAVIHLLLSSCRNVLKVSKYHLIMMLVSFDAPL